MNKIYDFPGNTNIKNELLNNGYYIFRNIINKEDIQFAKNNIVGNKVNYTNINKFINKSMLHTVNKELNWNMQCVKYRVSNNNNSKDAGAIHRDVIYFNVNKIYPVFTCLSYLDNTTMELYPNSYYYNNMCLSSAIKNYNKSIKVKINEGDILLFF